MEISPANRDRRRKPDDDATLRALAERYNAGASIRQIGVERGWCYGTTHRRIAMAHAAGLLVVRPIGGYERRSDDR